MIFAWEKCAKRFKGLSQFTTKFNRVKELARLRLSQFISGASAGLGTGTEATPGKPSAETLLHLAVVRVTGAGAVLHTHSVWSTILSDYHNGRGGFFIEGYEMLKGLEGIGTHEHREWVPILENSQDMRALAAETEALLRENSRLHGFLIRRHGLYTWGKDLTEAARHVEILEFLLESVGRRQMMEPQY